ncbi:MAG: hypothetical protein IJT30_10075 [Muribaculaceae bacterium]|nr:hypothetical protein [Muribaculaceae bacterium]
MKTLNRLAILLLMAVALVSCEWEDDDFLGAWESYAYNDGHGEYELYDNDRSTYVFYSDGTGYYSQWNFSTDFRWSEYSYGHLVLHHSDNLVEDFYYRFDRGDMLVSGDRSFYTYTVFSYRGRHHY